MQYFTRVFLENTPLSGSGAKAPPRDFIGAERRFHL
jgi:hypothetical protein